jgi:hypothetical protein
MLIEVFKMIPAEIDTDFDTDEELPPLPSTIALS